MSQPPNSSAQPAQRPGWLFVRRVAPGWNSYVFRGRFVDIQQQGDQWRATELCDDGLAAIDIATGDNEAAVFEAAEKALHRVR